MQRKHAQSQLHKGERSENDGANWYLKSLKVVRPFHNARTCPSAGRFLVHHLLMAMSTSCLPGPKTARVRENARIIPVMLN